MRSSTVRALLGFIALATLAATTGCSSAGALEVPRCPNPVLLGPVDRIGGHRADGAAPIARVWADVKDYVPKPTEDEEAMADVLGRRSSNDAKALSAKVLTATEGRPDRDVRVDRIEVGAFVVLLTPFVAVKHWTKISAKVVEVRK